MSSRDPQTSHFAFFAQSFASFAVEVSSVTARVAKVNAKFRKGNLYQRPDFYGPLFLFDFLYPPSET